MGYVDFPCSSRVHEEFLFSSFFLCMLVGQLIEYSKQSVSSSVQPASDDTNQPSSSSQSRNIFLSADAENTNVPSNVPTEEYKNESLSVQLAQVRNNDLLFYDDKTEGRPPIPRIQRARRTTIRKSKFNYLASSSATDVTPPASSEKNPTQPLNPGSSSSLAGFLPPTVPYLKTSTLDVPRTALNQRNKTHVVGLSDITDATSGSTTTLPPSSSKPKSRRQSSGRPPPPSRPPPKGPPPEGSPSSYANNPSTSIADFVDQDQDEQGSKARFTFSAPTYETICVRDEHLDLLLPLWDKNVELQTYISACFELDQFEQVSELDFAQCLLEYHEYNKAETSDEERVGLLMIIDSDELSPAQKKRFRERYYDVYL